jgi:lipopolysaccharide cholinephosphotransferase
VSENREDAGQGKPIELTIEQMRARQLRLLGAVADHCEAHGLRYYLCAGTLLGAVRHGGYIPWDDDIDLMLPRPDFEKLCASFPTPAAPEGVSLRALSSSPIYVLPFAKVCDDRTRLEVESDIIKGLGVFIDVFPLDGWSDRKAMRMLQRAALTGLPQVMRIKHVVLGRRRTVLRNALIAVAKVVLSVLRPRWVAATMEKVARLGKFDSCTFGGVIVWGYQESVPVAAYGVPGQLTFEDRSYDVPQDTDTVLRILYGDYMRMPPVEQQVTLHRFVAYEL